MKKNVGILIQGSYQQANSTYTLTCYQGQSNSFGINTVVLSLCSTPGGYCKVIPQINRFQFILQGSYRRTN